MPFVPLENGVMVEVIHTLFGAVCECTFSFQPHGSGGPPTLDTAALAVFQYWRDDILPLLSHELLFIRVKATDVSVVGGSSVEVDLPSPIPGGVISGSEPANVAVRVNIRVVNPPGGARGCLFLPGVPGNQVANNTLAPAWKADVNDVVSNLIDAAAIQGWTWVVPHRIDPGRGRPPVRVGLRADFVSIESEWVGQRRRRLHNEPF